MTADINIGDNYELDEDSNGNLVIRDSTGNAVLEHTDGGGWDVLRPISDEEYRIVDSNRNVVGTLFAESDGTLKLQEGTSGNENELVLQSDGTVQLDRAAVSEGSSKAVQDAAQTISSSTFTTISLDSTVRDELGIVDLSNNQFTIAFDGLYQIQSHISLSSVPADTGVLSTTVVNGSDVIKERETQSFSSNLSTSTTVTERLSAGDTVTFEMIITNGGDQDTLAGDDDTFIEISRLG